MSATMRLGTRPSRLAIRQAEEIKARLPHVRFEVIELETKGDKDKISPLSAKEGQDFFTYEIEKALLEGNIDAALHSAKDIEDSPPADLTIAATTRSISPFECLVSRGGLKLEELPFAAVVGTSSRKRKAAIQYFRRDLIVKDIRGNVDDRIRQLDEGKFDAIIVAHAALIRLGMEDRIADIIPDHVIRPHPLQGRLSIQVRSDRRDLIDLLAPLREVSEDVR
ncbi:MAG: hydroxymethylbilane synthase [Candidatus Omnitrophota bacterium]